HILDQNKDDSYIQSVIKSDLERNNLWYQYLDKNDQGIHDKWYEESLKAQNWKEFTIPNSWHDTELEEIRGSVWFTREFEIPTSLEKSEALLKLGTIVDADDTYINGIYIGSTGYRYPPRRYTVPSGLLKSGKNRITVRVISTQSIGEFIKDMPYQIMIGNEIISLDGTWKYNLGAQTEPLQSQTFFQY